MFTYNGYLGFDLKIFDRSGCERPPAYLHKCAMIDRKEAGEPYSADEDLPILGLTQNQIVNHQEVKIYQNTSCLGAFILGNS